ncbi:MAG: UDP-N-acetylglucosamine--dolichyl-phosphate N-acetylglucosaminephosphotransferase [Candidatus Nanohaloarchaea archaeon]|jgi:UDP-N-acetylglucosamine--dolichyl-phosphate N-acetylglucosaminephosphotransferase
MNLALLVGAGLLSFLSVVVGVPYARKYLLSSGIYGIDQQKKGKPKVATSGGVVVLFGLLFSTTAFLGIGRLLGIGTNVELVLASICSINIIALIGLIDDIHVGEEIRVETPTNRILEKIDVFGSDVKISDEVDRVGLSQFTKMLFVLPAVFPLMAVGAGSWQMALPIVGVIDWGLIYPLVLLPVGLLFVANVVNMLAGTNGLSAGLSFVASAGMALFAYSNGELEATLIAVSLCGALAGFLLYNWYPASILPGDSLTYLCGASLFSIMVLGNMEKFGVFIFAPWFAEFGLKARGKFDAHSWGLLKNGGLENQHDKIYSLTHIFMEKGLNEEEITVALVVLEAFVVSLGLLLFL